MRPSEALQRYRIDIRRIVEQNGAGNARVFGCVVHGNDTHGSDLELIVDPFDEEAALVCTAGIKLEVEALTGIETEIVTPMDLPKRCLRAVLAEAVPV
jgi:predicted nucleotidyltransferase